jgi:hypothetical protein
VGGQPVWAEEIRAHPYQGGYRDSSISSAVVWSRTGCQALRQGWLSSLGCGAGGPKEVCSMASSLDAQVDTWSPLGPLGGERRPLARRGRAKVAATWAVLRLP